MSCGDVRATCVHAIIVRIYEIAARGASVQCCPAETFKKGLKKTKFLTLFAVCLVAGTYPTKHIVLYVRQFGASRRRKKVLKYAREKKEGAYRKGEGGEEPFCHRI